MRVRAHHRRRAACDAEPPDVAVLAARSGASAAGMRSCNHGSAVFFIGLALNQSEPEIGEADPSCRSQLILSMRLSSPPRYRRPQPAFIASYCRRAHKAASALVS